MKRLFLTVMAVLSMTMTFAENRLLIIMILRIPDEVL